MAKTSLAVNQLTKIIRIVEGGRLAGVVIVAPVRGEGLRVTTFRTSEDRALCEALDVASGDRTETEIEVPTETLPRLEAAGLLLDEAHLPSVVLFRCDLDSVSTDCTDEDLRQLRLVVNPNIELMPGGVVPTRLNHSDEIARCLDPHGKVAWITDPRSSVTAPLWIPEYYQGRLQQILLGHISVSSLTDDELIKLGRASILIPASNIEQPALQTRADGFARDGYSIMTAPLPPHALLATQVYYRRLLAEGMLKSGDEMVAKRFAMPDEGLARLWHQQLVQQLSAVVRRDIKPSYSYVATYHSGASLKSHRDRQQCEYSMTWQVDYVSATNRRDWPIWVERRNIGGHAPIRVSRGDGLVYRGRELSHYRERLPDGDVSTHIFFHYVDASFDGPLI